jgi:hypothetical protein
MSYSRRQLYALGEPLGDSVTRKAGGKIIYGDGGGSSQPSTTTQTTDLPDWAKGYAKDTLAKGAALTDISQNPYQAYGGQRIAGFTPLQEQTFQTAAGMQPSSQLGLGTGLAGAAGLGALNTNYQAGRFSGGQFGNQQAAQYMSPYIEQAMQPQLREAQRASDIQGTQQRAQAVGAGAFGGSRQAIMEAERERNLGMQQSDIRAKGYQTAYEQAANQYNQDMARRLQAQQLGEQSRQYGAGLGMQGLQTALQSAGQLGQLGQTEYGQKMGITQLQSQLGSQQQQQAQRPLDVAYQDFLNQQNYPYKQLGFMSDLVRGLPLGQKSTSQVYEGSGPGLVQTLAGLGGAAYGFGKSGLFAAEGGLMESYADGGVTSPQNIENILSKLSDQQLAQAKEAALNRRDVQEAQMIDAEMAERASIRGGLGGAFNQIPMEQQEEMMAGGGIVAFAPGGATYLDKAEEARQKQMDYIRQATTQQTPEELKANVLSQRDVIKDLYGPSVVPKYLEEVKAERAALPEKMESEKGLAFAMASLKLLNPSKNVRGRSQGEQLISGLGEAGEAFAGEVNRLKKEHKEADRLLRQSELQLATADQLYNNGLTDKAVAKADQAQALKSKAAEMYAGVAGDTSKMYAQLENTKLGKDAQIEAAKISQAGHIRGAQIAAAKETDLARQTRIRYESLIEQGKPANKQTMAEAAALAASDVGRYPGAAKEDIARETLTAKKQDKAEAAWNQTMLNPKDPAYIQMKNLKKSDPSGAAAEEFKARWIQNHMDKSSSDAPQAAPAPAPAPVNTVMPSRGGPPIKVTSQEQFAKLPSGTTFVAPDGSIRIKP